ncbi:hypothetical protein CMI41_00325 [Candidatus Pacearchaeota archaeon]|nr:hypothetical protein [Candidatus Pacearchaeota archaeon]|tara:strand:+ start:1085 stop:1396 length:312 start_codon:yes stop_codon:yes gene_type:complete
MAFNLEVALKPKKQGASAQLVVSKNGSAPLAVGDFDGLSVMDLREYMVRLNGGALDLVETEENSGVFYGRHVGAYKVTDLVGGRSSAVALLSQAYDRVNARNN